ncbi:TetR/AcrR family transcriptional regulator [Nocardioides bruguierae]|uniref:TetR/AcrR family transcriptional regulator n=1 Tax=Nocardioides bruguierae TaxID=2945102 RepID=UPI002022277D|nr:TetR/AcrR family transcriptional regulator [Nocardioides bruguierae]MCL8026750.1 TetR/AcrR family transcriptional regulator [Nocardioides bruguierae]
MGRWQPGARGRLERAALTLSAEQGYEATTVAQIAAAAGVTERTFYRHFPDKVDAFFPDNTDLLATLATTAREAQDAGAPPRDAAMTALRLFAGYVAEEPERPLLSARVIPTVPALAGRDLLRQQQMVGAMAEGLVAGGADPVTARLAGEAALSAWRTALTIWRADATRALTDVVDEVASAASAL